MLPITPRQRQILDLMWEGLQPKTIATRLGITSSTLSEHQWRIAKRIGAPSMYAILPRAFHLGLLGRKKGEPGPAAVGDPDARSPIKAGCGSPDRSAAC